jgi:SAM-dependent methyltransferase
MANTNLNTNSYIGRHAELYDLFYADKPYILEASFVQECLHRYGDGEFNRLLDIACGTGQHAIALNDLGFDIIGVDYSEDMIACARRKIKQRRSLYFRVQDMRSLSVSEKPFDAITCLFDSIGYVATNEGLIKALNGVYDHLRPGGLFIFEFWHAGAMLRKYEPTRVRRWSTSGGDILRISETELICRDQLSKVTYTIYDLRDNGTYSMLKESQINRYFLVQEIAGWLTRCGFTPLKWFAGFTDNENITEDTWHVVAVAQRP